MTSRISPAEFKAALAAVATPVTVVTTVHDGRPHGTTVSSFCSLSLEPAEPLMYHDRTFRALAALPAQSSIPA